MNRILLSKSRVLKAFHHEEADRVPLFEVWIESEIVEALGGDPYLVRIKLNMDCLPLGSYPKTCNAYGNGVDSWGRIFKNGQYAGGLVTTWNDLERYTTPLSYAAEWFPKDNVDKIKKKYSDYALYFAWHDCSLGLSYMSMGLRKFFIGLYEDPDFVKAVINRSTEWIIALVEQANNYGCDFIVLGDDAADNTRPMISPTMFRKLILPQYKRIVASSDIPILWHSDGFVEPLLPIIIEAGFAGVHSLEEKAGNDLACIKEKYGHELVLAGNLDATSVLSQSNLKIVRQDVERCIREGAPGGGYLFSSSNSLFEGHNISAIREAYRYAKEIGKYPISLDI